MKCSDCIYFGYRFMAVRWCGYCAAHGFVADPDDEGACEDGEPEEREE